MTPVKYPIGIQSFEKIRTENYIYVDKTDMIHELVSSGTYYFLSRPRRFGKSLLVSTIEAYFQGKRHLFSGLAIDSLATDWEPSPVLHIDLNAKNYQSATDLVDILSYHLEDWEKEYGLEMSDRSPEERFSSIVRRAHEVSGRKVVILVDEYDKPLLLTAHDHKINSEIRDIMKAFYGVLKSRDADIRFALLTGVTKFSKVSIFSDLNNLNDITLDNRYATLCGITPNELETEFTDGLTRMTAEFGITREECLEMLKENYDGYHFSNALKDVYNPFSLLNALSKCDIGAFWFETGTPTFLARMLSRDGADLRRLEDESVATSRMQTADLISGDPIPVLFQSGYLTIKSYDFRMRRYTLGYPNREVKEGFLNFLLPYYTPGYSSSSAFDIVKFVDDVEHGRPDDFMKRLSALFSGYPYDHISDCERHYHNVVYLTMTLLGFYVRSEYRTSDGRCDAIVETADYVYIFEFKYNRTAREALDQIKTKRYDSPYAADQRCLFRIGVNFSSATRSIDSYMID